VLARLDEHCDHRLVHTGQNYDYELNQVFFDDLGVRKPDYFLNSAEGSTGAANTIGNLITAVDGVLAQELPEALLVLGDTNSCLSVIPAKRRKVPIFHMEAGNRCFDQRVPEETNRRIVDHTAAPLPETTYCAKACRPIRSSRLVARCTRCCTTTFRKSRLRMR